MEELRKQLDSLEAKQEKAKGDPRLSPTGREEALRELKGQINETWQKIDRTYQERAAELDKQISVTMRSMPTPWLEGAAYVITRNGKLLTGLL